MSRVIEKFLRYVAVDTQSKEGCDQVPSTKKQFDLAELLKKELEEMGASHVRMDSHCYVYATIPATAKGKPSIGFISHMDTSDAVSGKDVKPQIVKKYDGGTIVLNPELGYEMSPQEFPILSRYVGKDLIVTDGTTLLGADDKAGVAEIMEAAQYLLEHPEIPHGPIQIGFTPDEEVGRGVDFFDVKGFGAEFAYTVDGGDAGELEYENFNATGFRVFIKGTSIHPGSAKGKMKHALLMGMELERMLPEFDKPAYTEGYEGFYHLTDMSGTCDSAQMEYIIRDHDAEKFDRKVAFFRDCVAFLNRKYGEDTFTLKELHSYRNMKEMVEPHKHLLENARAAIEEAGLTPVTLPIRGGTDGARLSYMGLPCPNLGTGGQNFHGRFEFACVQSMETCVEIILNIIKKYGE